MLTRKMAVSILVLSLSCSITLHGQQKPAASGPTGAAEFPVILQQGITAGKTPVGAKVQAKLTVATLVNGTVVPRNAVFSGEVIESTAKTKTDPSRLAIRMDSVQWKDGSASLKVYLTAWYYPTRYEMGQAPEYGPQKPATRTWNGAGTYPDPNSSDTYKPFPTGNTDQGDSVPNTPSATTSNRRVQMKNVETSSGGDGTVTLVSKRNNLKLDKLTTYVFSGSELAPAK
jgi:hypothetical protein